MKSETKLILIINAIICLVIQSCKYEKPEINWSKYGSCLSNQKTDTTALANNLVGKWVLVASRSFWGYGTYFPESKIIAEFTSDRKVTVTENGSIASEGHWCFGIEDYDNWCLATDSPHYSHYYFYGIIGLCNNDLIFNDSYIDGEDNLFMRIK